MSYLSLARKYRPQTFDELVGQEHVAVTLKNAIATDRVAHAYLFAGPRGVGKTSTARILAKSLNCEKGPGPAPCGACAACREISEGRGMDVMEIDGASNRGIDEIRNLRENIKFAPIHGKFRIYIIDEVHMLTQEAFNALLKTLEEPPLHVKFIFATTRPYKVLPTVISRCQRFDFRAISAQDIAGKLGEIREKEKLGLTDEAVSLIAKASDGSLRDAEVILDQLLAFTKGKVESSDVVKVLGLLEAETLFEIADAVLANDKRKLLNLINDLVASGRDPVFITSSIINHFRNILVASVTKEKDASGIAFPGEDYHKYAAEAKRVTTDEVLYIIYTLSACMDLIKKTSLGRIPLEVSLLKLAGGRKAGSIKEILERLTVLEERLKASGDVAGSVPSLSEIASPRPSVGARNDGWPGAPKEAPAIPEDKITEERDILLFQKIKDLWGKILNLIKTRKMSVATFLGEATLLRVKDNVFAVGFDKNSSLHKEALEEVTNRGFVEEAIENITGERVRLRVETLEDEAREESASIPAPEEDEAKEAVEEDIQEKPNKIDPIIDAALDVFEGRVIDIRKKKENKD